MEPLKLPKILRILLKKPLFFNNYLGVPLRVVLFWASLRCGASTSYALANATRHITNALRHPNKTPYCFFIAG